MADRYFTDQPIEGTTATLEGPEAHHLAHVMRAKPGDELILFDGSGAEFPARIESVGRSRVVLRVLGKNIVDREPPVPVVLAVALPKGDRQKWLIEKATEVGVTRLIPLRTHRAVAAPSPEGLQRLRRGVVEASKQCGRNRLMEIAEPLDWQAFLAQTAHFSARLLAHPGSADSPAEWSDAGNGCVGAVGPEGGFTGDEVSLARAAGWRLVDLGPRILRVETAAVVLAVRLGMLPSACDAPPVE